MGHASTFIISQIDSVPGVGRGVECHKFDIALKDDSWELLLMRDFVFFIDPQLLFIQAKHIV